MIIRSSSGGNSNHQIIKANKSVEPLISSVAGFSVQKGLESASLENKRANQSKPSKKRLQSKTALEILMEED